MGWESFLSFEEDDPTEDIDVVDWDPLRTPPINNSALILFTVQIRLERTTCENPKHSEGFHMNSWNKFIFYSSFQPFVIFYSQFSSIAPLFLTCDHAQKTKQLNFGAKTLKKFDVSWGNSSHLITHLTLSIPTSPGWKLNWSLSIKDSMWGAIKEQSEWWRAALDERIPRGFLHSVNFAQFDTRDHNVSYVKTHIQVDQIYYDKRKKGERKWWMKISH